LKVRRGIAIRIKKKKPMMRGKPSRYPRNRSERPQRAQERKIEEQKDAVESPENMSERGFVMPGDLIGTSEEFTPAEGTYEEGGEIFASATGRVSVNLNSRAISITSRTKTPPRLSLGDVVIGRVSDVKSSMVLVEMAHIKGKGEREFVSPGDAVIHVSNIKDSYVKDILTEFQPFDIVKAKVIDVRNTRLSTLGEEFGVMKAFCTKCRGVLRKTENSSLKCSNCDRVETRKISSDYGTGII